MYLSQLARSLADYCLKIVVLFNVSAIRYVIFPERFVRGRWDKLARVLFVYTRVVFMMALILVNLARIRSSSMYGSLQWGDPLFHDSRSRLISVFEIAIFVNKIIVYLFDYWTEDNEIKLVTQTLMSCVDLDTTNDNNLRYCGRSNWPLSGQVDVGFTWRVRCSVLFLAMLNMMTLLGSVIAMLLYITIYGSNLSCVTKIELIFATIEMSTSYFMYSFCLIITDQYMKNLRPLDRQLRKILLTTENDDNYHQISRKAINLATNNFAFCGPLKIDILSMEGAEHTLVPLAVGCFDQPSSNEQWQARMSQYQRWVRHYKMQMIELGNCDTGDDGRINWVPTMYERHQLQQLWSIHVGTGHLLIEIDKQNRRWRSMFVFELISRVSLAILRLFMFNLSTEPFVKLLIVLSMMNNLLFITFGCKLITDLSDGLHAMYLLLLKNMASTTRTQRFILFKLATMFSQLNLGFTFLDAFYLRRHTLLLMIGWQVLGYFEVSFYLREYGLWNTFLSVKSNTTNSDHTSSTSVEL